jgi:hypothetical protein
MKHDAPDIRRPTISDPSAIVDLALEPASGEVAESMTDTERVRTK